MTVDHTRDHVASLRALHAADPSAHALALADQLSKLSVDVGLRGDYDAYDALSTEAFAALEASPYPAGLSDGHALRFASLAGVLAVFMATTAVHEAAQGLTPEPPDVAVIGGRALALADRAVATTQALAHLAGASVAQPVFDAPVTGPPEPPDPWLADPQFAAARRAILDAPPPPSPYADDDPAVPFAPPPGAKSRPERGYHQPFDWTVVHAQALHHRSRVLAVLGHTEPALEDAIAALATNLLGTELDYARMVVWAASAMNTAALLIEDEQPEGGPLGW